ncbi:major facilitator superfamily domain-containing protein 9-like, partial [Aphis craccivora]
ELHFSIMFKYSYIYAIVFLDLISISLIIPVWGTHLRSLGASHFHIALLGSTYSFLQFLSGTPIGALSDHYGRKAVLIVTICICSVAYFLLGCVKSFILIVLIRVLQGCLKHSQLLCKTLVNDQVPADQQTTIYGRMNGFSSLSFVIGPIIGGHLMEKSEGFYSLACSTAIIFLINALVVYFTVPNTIVPKKERKNASPLSDLMEVNWKECWPAFSLKMLGAAALFAYFSTVGLAMNEKFNLSPSEAGYTGALQGLTGGITGFAAGKIENIIFPSKNPFTKCFYSFIMLGIGFVGLALAPNLIIFMAAMVPISASSTLIRGFNNEIMYEQSSSDHKGLVAGAGASAAAISRFLAPIICGFTMDMFGNNSGFLLSALFSFTGAVLSLCLTKKSKAHVE